VRNLLSLEFNNCDLINGLASLSAMSCQLLDCINAGFGFLASFPPNALNQVMELKDTADFIRSSICREALMATLIADDEGASADVIQPSAAHQQLAAAQRLDAATAASDAAMEALLAEEEGEAAKKAATLAKNQRRRTKQKKKSGQAHRAEQLDAAVNPIPALCNAAASLSLEPPECIICLDAVASRGTACCQPPVGRILQACAACAARLAKCPTCQGPAVWME
jgi:hypothetical protein